MSGKIFPRDLLLDALDSQDGELMSEERVRENYPTLGLGFAVITTNLGQTVALFVNMTMIALAREDVIPYSTVDLVRRLGESTREGVDGVVHFPGWMLSEAS